MTKIECEKGAEFTTSKFSGYDEITGIAVPESVTVLTFGSSEPNAKPELYRLQDVKKTFPQVTELHICKNVPLLEITNQMFPNVRKVVSDSPAYISGTMLVEHRFSKSYALRNSFCLADGEEIDLSGIQRIEQHAFCGCQSTNIKNAAEVVLADASAFEGSAFFNSPKDGLYLAGDNILIGICEGMDIVIPNTVSCIATGVPLDKAKSLTIQNLSLLRHHDAYVGTELVNPMMLVSVPAHLTCPAITEENLPILMALCRQNSSGMEYLTASGCGLQTREGLLYSQDGTTLVRCPASRHGALTIPKGTLSISKGAFFNCSLDSLQIPGSVEVIAKRTFRDCVRLSRVVLEPGIRKIEQLAFSCPSIGCITVPDTVEQIGAKAFLHAKTVIISGSRIPAGLFAAITASKESDLAVSSPYSPFVDVKQYKYTTLQFDDFTNYIPKLVHKEAAKTKLTAANYKDSFIHATQKKSEAQEIAYQYLEYLYKNGVSITKLLSRNPV